jgi:quercetin dioxygenase-like cupin family protein
MAVELDVRHAALVPSGGGEVINDSADHAVRLLFAHELLTVTLSDFAPGEPGTDPHVHREHTDAFYVLGGEFELTLGPDAPWVPYTAGTFAAVPPNTVHAFRAGNAGRVRFLNFHAPNGGFAEYLRGENESFDSYDPPSDGGEPATGAIVSPPGEGEKLPRGNRFHTIKGQLPHIAVIELAFEPGWEGVEPHSHDDHVDAFFVLDGAVRFLAGEGGAETFFAAPPHAVHGFEIADQHPIRVLNMHAPDTGFTDRLRRG